MQTGCSERLPFVESDLWQKSTTECVSQLACNVIGWRFVNEWGVKSFAVSSGMQAHLPIWSHLVDICWNWLNKRLLLASQLSEKQIELQLVVSRGDAERNMFVGKSMTKTHGKAILKHCETMLSHVHPNLFQYLPMPPLRPRQVLSKPDAGSNDASSKKEAGWGNV